MIRNFRRAAQAALLGAAALLGVACAGGAARAQEQPQRNKLLVVIVIDQFRYDYMARFADLYDPKEGAFLGIRKHGAWYANANYGHATTYTGPGHAHILSGGYAYQTGMVGNKWYDRKTGKSVAIAGDPEAHLLGAPGDESEGTSPRNFVGTNLGDELVLNTQGRAKVVTIALKSRAAVLLGGKLGKAYWFNDTAGEYTTSTYYAKELPAWVVEWNKKRMADASFGKAWTPVVPEEHLAALASEDAMPWEGDLFGLGRTFPHPLTGGPKAGGKPSPDYYDALVKTPFANDMELDFARAAVEGEGLGKDDAPDILAISLSANDEVGHTFGPYSREVVDMSVQTDRQLGAFLRWLDQKVPGYTLAFTADHGASPMPEYMARMGVEAHRIKKKQLKAAVENALTARFGDPKLVGEKEWVVGIEDPSVYLNEKLISQVETLNQIQPHNRNTLREEVERAAAATLTAIPGVLTCYTRTDLLRGTPAQTPMGRMYQLCFYPERSGDVFVATKPYSFWGKYAEKDYGDSHGSPFAYDTHVPLALVGNGIARGIHEEAVAIADLVPTLASLLGVNPPPCAEGKPLPGAIRKY